MRVLLKLRNLHPHPVIRGCNGYEAVLLKHRRAVCVLRASLWSSSSSSTPSASTSKAPDHALVPPGTNNTLPVKFDEQSKVEGAENQCEFTGNLIYMSEGVEMETSTGGGAGKMFSRVLTGQNLMVTDFSYSEENAEVSSGTVALGARIPSKIIKVNLEDSGGALVCQKGAFLAGSSTIDITTEFTRTFGAGFFGGEGFILQRLSGDGEALICGSGHIIKRELKEGETLRVSSGCVVAFNPSVAFDIQMVKGGIFSKNALFGGEGIFLTSLTGPGTIWLSGLPFDRMVGEIESRIPIRGGGIGIGIPPIMMPGGGGAEGGGGEGNTIGDGGEGAASVDALNQGTEASNSHDGGGGIYGDATPSPSETINIDDDFDPSADSTYSGDDDEDSPGVARSLWDWWNEP